MICIESPSRGAERCSIWSGTRDGVGRKTGGLGARNLRPGLCSCWIGTCGARSRNRHETQHAFGGPGFEGGDHALRVPALPLEFKHDVELAELVRGLIDPLHPITERGRTPHPRMHDVSRYETPGLLASALQVAKSLKVK